MSPARSRGSAVCALALLGASPLPSRECGSWPGEPEPLPQVGVADEFAAGWASLRRDELRGLALLLEGSDPVEARRVWLHAACLAPGDPEVAAALARTAEPVVHRVDVIGVRAPPAVEVARRATLGAALDVLDSPVRVRLREPAAGMSAAGFDFAPVDAQIDTAREYLDQARFQAAVDASDLARARLVRLASAAPVRARRVRLELLAATAHLALERDQDARSCVERALRESPDLSLDPAESPPKLQRLVDETREHLGETP